MDLTKEINTKSIIPDNQSTVIFCSNYHGTNDVINFPVTTINLKSIFDIGVWKIKQLKK